MHRWIPLVLALCLAGSAAPAAAQFTAAVVPPKTTSAKAAPSPIAAEPEPTTTAPTQEAQKTLSSMKAWVDSAAIALANEPATQPESTTAAPATAAPTETTQRGKQQKAGAPPAKVNESHGEVSTFRNGARAPATATPLPALALLGVASLIAGALLRRRWS